MSLFNKVKIKVKAKRNVGLQNKRYSLKNKARSGVVVGTRLVSVGGQLFESNFVGNIGDTVTVTNVGTPAAALYAQSTTGAVSTSSGTSTGTATIVSDGALATIQAHMAQGYVEGHGTSPASRQFHSIKYGVVGGTDVDESVNVGAMFHTVGSNGGGKCIIASADGVSPIRLDDLAGIYHSNMDIEFRSPIISGAGGGVRAMGAMDEYVRAPATFAGGLSIDASVGDTTVTLSGTAGKMQASDYLPGDLVTIRGENNAKGEALTKQILTILSVNSGANTITFAEELEYDFLTIYPSSAYGPTDATTIFLNRTWALTTNLVRGAMVAIVSDTTGMAVGDMVRVSDSRVEIDLNPAAYRSGGAGPYENECRLEYRIITAIDTGTDTVTFDKPISKGYLQGSPYFGNLAKVLPVENVHIRGINLTYYEPQTDRNIHAISLNFAKDSTIEDCHVNGINGGMGQQYRISDSYNCWGYRSIGRDPLYHDSAEGYIFALYKSDASGWRHCLATGGRHNFLVQAATNFTIDSCQSYDSWISGIDTHGVDEYDGLITNCLMSQTNKHAPGVSNGACGRNGNTSHTVGSHWVVWQNCVFFGNPETSIYGLDVLAASTHVIIDSCKFFGGDYGIRNSKNPSQCMPTQTVSDLTIRDCEFHNIAVRPVYLEGIPDTAGATRSSGKLDYVLLDGNTTWNCAQHFHVSGGDAITNLTVSRNRAIRPVTSPGNDYYGLVVTDTDGLMVDGNNFHLCSRGISLTDATNAAIIGNTLTATVDAIPVTLAGTNTGPGGGTLIYVANIVDNSSVGGSASPAFTSDISITGTDPQIAWVETGVAANNTTWDILAQSEQWQRRVVDDTYSSATIFETVDRTNNTVDAIAWTATTLGLNGLVRITNAAPQLAWYESDAGADLKQWDAFVNSSVWYLRAVNDATSIASNLISVDRSGNTTLLGNLTTPVAAIDKSSNPYLFLRDQSRGTDLKIFDILNTSSILKIRAVNDAYNTALDLLALTRSGDLTVTGTLNSGRIWAAPDTDNASVIHRAAIGGVYSDVATFSHLDQNGANTYFLAHSAAGAGFINAVTGQTISMRVNQVDKLVVSSTGVTVTGTLSVSGTLTTDGPITDGNGGYKQHFSFSGLSTGVVVDILPNDGDRAAGVVVFGILKHSVVTGACSRLTAGFYSGLPYNEIMNGTDTFRMTCSSGGKVSMTHYAGSSGTFSGSFDVYWSA